MFEGQRVEVLRRGMLVCSRCLRKTFTDFGDDKRGIALILVAAKSYRRDGFAARESQAERPVVELRTELQHHVRLGHGR